MPAAKRRRETSDDEDAQEPDTPRFGAGEGELSQTVYAVLNQDPDVYIELLITFLRNRCSLCRHRKARCDRRKPRCGLCIKNDMDCEYVVTQKKRGLRAGYVSELERRLGTKSVSFSHPLLRQTDRSSRARCQGSEVPAPNLARYPLFQQCERIRSQFPEQHRPDVGRGTNHSEFGTRTYQSQQCSTSMEPKHTRECSSSFAN